MLLMRQSIGTVAYMGGLMAVPEPFVWSLTQMLQYSSEHLCAPNQIIHLTKSITSYHAWARNGIAENILGDWVLMLDTDQTFEPDLLCRMVSLLNEFDLDVLTGLYHYKIPPHNPVLYAWDAQGQQFHGIAGWSTPGRLLRVDCAGAGCLMIRRRVFERIAAEMKQKPFDPIGVWSEDFSFFVRLIQLGIKVYCAPDIETYHLMVQTISSEHADYTAVEKAPPELVKRM